MIDNTLYKDIHCTSKAIHEHLKLNIFERSELKFRLNNAINTLHDLHGIGTVSDVEYRIYCVLLNGTYFLSVQVSIPNSISPKQIYARINFTKNKSGFKTTGTDYVP